MISAPTVPSIKQKFLVSRETISVADFSAAGAVDVVVDGVNL
jgi:ribose 5-phosphate isomerase